MKYVTSDGIEKTNPGWLIPRSLVKAVNVAAAMAETKPSRFVERLLIQSLRDDGSSSSGSVHNVYIVGD